MNNVLSEEQEHLLDLPAYLARAGMAKDLFDLLTDFEFIEAKISAVGTPPLIEDYDLVTNLDPPQPPLKRGEQENTLNFSQSGWLREEQENVANQGQKDTLVPPFLKGGLGGDRAETLKLIQGALRLSAHILDLDKTQLLGQLCGRLMCFNTAEIQAMLSRGINLYASKPRLRPLTASLTPSGGRLLRTLIGHTSEVRAVAITPDGKQAISGSWDNSLKLWDLTTGKELFSLTGHTGSVNAVAITPDGKQAISGSSDKSLKLWDLTTGTELFSLTGHTDYVIAVAITPDGKQAISASRDNSLKLWDLQSREVIASFSGESALYCCAVAPDGVTIVAGEASGRVHFLRLEGVSKF